MILTRDEGFAALRTRGYPPIFARIWEGQIPRSLMGSCAEPRRYFQLAPALRASFPKAEGYLPLWETNLEAVVAYDTVNDEYIRYYYGDAGDLTLGKSYQQFLTAFFIELADSGLGDEELDAVAAEFEYRHLMQLRRFLDSTDPNEYEHSNRRFISTIP
jgi:hypothetical protein